MVKNIDQKEIKGKNRTIRLMMTGKLLSHIVSNYRFLKYPHLSIYDYMEPIRYFEPQYEIDLYAQDVSKTALNIVEVLEKLLNLEMDYNIPQGSVEKHLEVQKSREIKFHELLWQEHIDTVIKRREL